jgi:hypothetical protein
MGLFTYQNNDRHYNIIHNPLAVMNPCPNNHRTRIVQPTLELTDLPDWFRASARRSSSTAHAAHLSMLTDKASERVRVRVGEWQEQCCCRRCERARPRQEVVEVWKRSGKLVMVRTRGVGWSEQRRNGEEYCGCRWGELEELEGDGLQR